jgi:DNA-binding NarL/FixJ family response regulator
VPHIIAFALRPASSAFDVIDALRADPFAELLDLEPLSREDSLKVLADVDDDAMRERIADLAAGNPLYLHELARAATPYMETLPPTLLSVIGKEIVSLPPATRSLLDGAAVAGDPFDPELAAAAADLDPNEALVPMNRLVSADLVRSAEGPRRFEFRHSLVRQAVYEATPAGWRLEAHERVANLLARRPVSPEARAYHVEQFARPGDAAAVELLAEAASSAALRSPGTAARWYGAALSLLGSSDWSRRAELLGPYALALGATGRLEECRDVLIEAIDIVSVDDRPALICACAEVENVLGRHANAAARLNAALEELPADAPAEARAMLEVQLSWVAIYLTDIDGVVDAASRAASAVAGSGGAIEAAALGSQALGLKWAGRGEDAAATLDRAAPLLSALTDEALADGLDAAVTVSFAQLWSERFEDAAITAARGQAVIQEQGADRLMAPLSLVESMARANQLQLVAALRAAEMGEEAARLGGLRYQLLFALWQRAQILEMQGDIVDSRRAAEECRSLIAGLEPNSLTLTGICNLAVLEVEHDPARALREIVSAAGPQLERIDPVWSTFVSLAAVRAAISVGDLDAAERWASLTEERASSLALTAGAVRAATARAMVSLAVGLSDQAASLALSAVEDGLRFGAIRDAMEARLVAGRALAAAGRREEAIATLQALAAAATAGGANRLVDAAARELRALGSRVAAATLRGGSVRAFDELSDREREIAELVVSGLSNKQVAAKLFLSEKTVESHLSRVYAKVGVRSRVELTRALAT